MQFGKKSHSYSWELTNHTIDVKLLNCPSQITDTAESKTSMPQLLKHTKVK